MIPLSAIGSSLAKLGDYALIGELGQSGEVRRVKGVLPIALKAKQKGLRGIIVPDANAEEVRLLKGWRSIPSYLAAGCGVS